MAQHDHQHDHEHGSELSQTQLRVRALETVLTEKGYVDPAALDILIETYETKVGPHNGARVVAKAWVDADFRARLLHDATEAIASLGYTGRQGEHMVALENTERVHNMVVCTLCSCYPWSVLGLPPIWYKSAPYRSRAVIDPHGVLRDFDVMLADGVELRVWDSTAEIRYLVFPMRPTGTEGWSEEELASLVTREELADGHMRSPPVPTPGVLAAEGVAAMLARGKSTQRPISTPARFGIGDAVRTRVINIATHTRLPRYCRGKQGTIVAVHGSHVFPDTN